MKESKTAACLIKIISLSLLLTFSLASTAYSNQCYDIFQRLPRENTASNLQKNYNEASAEIIPHILQKLEFRLIHLKQNNFTPKTMGELRKYILEIRFILEVFAPTYSRTNQNDPWLEMWKNLKAGYSLIGNYRAVSKSNTKKKAQAMTEAQNWVETMLNGKLKTLSQNLAKAHLPTVQNRIYPKGLQWDNSLLKPTGSRTAEQIFGELSLDILAQAKAGLPKLMALRDFLDPIKSESFHAFRKQLRTAVKIANFLSINTKDNHPLLTQFLYDMGKINDKVEPLQKKVKKGRITSIEQTQKQGEITELWNQFLRDYDQVPLTQALDALIKDLQ